MYIVAWLSTARLTAFGGGERDVAYWSAQLAAYSSASNTDIYHGRERRWDAAMELDWYGWSVILAVWVVFELLA